MTEHHAASKDANSGKGVHVIQRWSDVADEAALATLGAAQAPADRGGVVYQTGGLVPGFYVADGAGGWSQLAVGGTLLTFGGGNVSAAGTTPRYLNPWYSSAGPGTDEVFMRRTPARSKIDQLRLHWPSGGGASVDVAFDLRVGGVDTALDVTALSDALSAENLTNVVDVPANSHVSLGVVKGASTGSAMVELQASMRMRFY